MFNEPIRLRLVYHFVEIVLKIHEHSSMTARLKLRVGAIHGKLDWYLSLWAAGRNRRDDPWAHSVIGYLKS